MIWSFISYLIASLLLHCCMSLALLPGTSPIACAAVDVGGPRKKRCVFVPYARATELVVSGLCHTTLSHTLFQTQLSNAPSFTHNFVTHSLAQTTFTHHLSLSSTIFQIQLCHTHTQFFLINFSHTFFFTSRSFTSSFVFPSFPFPLQHVLLITGRSWLVGLSGPLILSHCFLTMFSR